MGHPRREPLPLWEKRLTRFLGNDRTPWPLQWQCGKHGVACVRCGNPLLEREPSDLPTCSECHMEVERVCQAFDPNDWTKRYRVVQRLRLQA